ncbi:sensor histidine kinase [Kiloniella litopenaei]|uniref:sensor histidine kinase n=1 Tax=Kiloniella litopenaei TaxID=1549748 RepID=UPI003BAB2D67
MSISEINTWSSQENENAIIQAFEFIKDPIIVCRPDSTVLAINKAALNLFSSLEVLPEAGNKLINFSHNKEKLLSLLNIAKAVTGHIPLPISFAQELIRDQRERNVEGLVARRISVNGVCPLILIEKAPIGGMVTKLNHLQEELETAKNVLKLEKKLRLQLESEYQSLDRFSAIAAHDLKSPIGHIVTSLSYLKNRWEKTLPAKELEWLDLLEASGLRLETLIDDLLLYTRSVNSEITLEDVDLNDLLDGIVTDLGDEVLKASATISIDQLPIIKADLSLSRLVFQNLILNAIKFRDADREPFVKISSGVDEEGATRIIVSDNGMGFDNRMAKTMFSPFKRLETDRKIDGHGLGLATVDQIISHHGWSISVDGKKGVGATFKIIIPPEA